MVICPICHAEILVSPGALFAQCPNESCGTSFELDENGNIDPSSLGSVDDNLSPQDIAGASENYENPEVIEQYDISTIEQSTEDVEDSFMAGYDAESAGGEVVQDAVADDSVSEEIPEQAPIEEDYREDWNEVAQAKEDAENGPDPIGVVAYDKTDHSQSIQGIFYDIILENLDTIDIKTALFKILEQARFGINVEAARRSLKGGELILTDLNPVVASVLIGQLRDLDIKISWRQSLAIMDNSESPPEEEA